MAEIPPQTYFEHLTIQHSDIQFTTEIQKNNCFLFLDMLVTRLSNWRLTYLIYRKPTLTDRYVHAYSQQKLSDVNALVQRAISISEPEIFTMN